MRKLSRMMIGLLLTATVVAPIAVQAQEIGRGRGGDGSDRGGGDRGGWRGGGDRGAAMNGDARREAIQQAREAQRQVERPAPLMQPRDTAPERRPEYRGDRGEGNRAGAGDDRAQELERRAERRREMVTEGSRWNNRGDRDNGDRGRRYDDRRDARHDWDRGRDGNRDDDRGRTGDRRDWSRDRDDNRDVNRRWTGDRRDWGRDGHRSWSSDRRDWDRRDHRDWRRDWRSDRRYGWQNYRNSHRHIYRLPRYEARHGYSYRRWYPGYRWDSWFYSSSFWINNPWQYRLPPAYGPYRWVRYYDDVVLVDIDTGEIVDIIYDFFW
jgi:hypothetical protein